MKLSTNARENLPESAFALPNRRYPIHDRNHAKAALMLMHNASPAEQAVIKRKVKERYPDLS